LNADATGNPIRVLLVYTDMLPSVEISQLAPLRHLAAQGRVELKHGTFFDFSAGGALTWCDIVIFCRCCLSSELPFLLKAQALRIPYIYDLDDNFFRLTDADLPGAAPLRWAGAMETLRAFVAGAAFVKVGSPQLLEDASSYNSKCVIHPYSFDFSIVSDVRRRPRQDRRIRIGYAGTVGHSTDFALVAGAVRRVLAAYADGVLFTFYGPAAEEFREFPNVRFVPYLPNYRAFLRDFCAEGWDIAIAPLRDTVWNRSKTNNKYREYAACRIAGVYSDMPVYNTCVRQSATGLLCADTEDAWYNALTALIEDPALLDGIRESAFQDVAANYSVDAAAERLWKELIVPAHANGKPIRRERRKRHLRRGMPERGRRRAQILCGDQSMRGRLVSWKIVSFRTAMQRARSLAKSFLRRYALGRYNNKRREG